VPMLSSSEHDGVPLEVTWQQFGPLGCAEHVVENSAVHVVEAVNTPDVNRKLAVTIA